MTGQCDGLPGTRACPAHAHRAAVRSTASSRGSRAARAVAGFGGSVWTTFRYVALPLARPGVVVGTILAFIFSWNNFVFGAVLAGRTTRTLPAAVYNVLTFEQLAWGPLAAAAIVVTLPVLLLTVFIQKEIVAGLTQGGVKGG